MRITDTLSRVSDVTSDGVLVLAGESIASDASDPVILYANPAFARLSGYAADDLVGRPLSIMHGADSCPNSLERLFRAATEGRAHEEELIQYQREGTPFWANLSLHPVFDQGGRRTSLMAVYRDITVHKRAQQDIAERERRLAELQRIAGLGWWECDLRSGRTTCSLVVSRILGLADGDPPPTMEEMKGFVHPDDHGLARGLLQKGSSPCSLELRIVRPDGETRWVHNEVTVERDAAGRAVRLLGVIRDVTERQRTTEALRRAKEAAELANLNKSSFLAAASHDLRQPLNAMSLLLGVLQTRETTPGTEGVIDQLRQSLDAMMELFNALLDLSQFEMGAYRVHRSAVGLDRLLTRLSVDFAGPAKVKGVELRIVGSRATLETDPTLMERILRNLVSNGIRYTPAGGKVLLGCRRFGDRMRIDVLDTGPGIPPEQTQAIFDEFRQIGNLARRREEGHGLGLAIVKRASDLLTHPLEVESTPGRGTRFSVTVPLAEPVSVASAAVEGGDVPTKAVGCGPVLVIEDDPLVSIAMRMMLEEYGCRVRSAHSGAEALELARDVPEPFRLVLADFRLPGDLDGIATVAALRALMGSSAVTGIVTGDLSEDIRSRAAHLGARCLLKPVRPEDLRALVEAARA